MATRTSPDPGPGPRDPGRGDAPDWVSPAAAAWTAERLEILAARRSALLVAAGAVVLLGLAGALLAPSLIPPRPLVGAAVGFAAVVLGVAAAIAVDSADLIVRGPRHVRAAGADLLGVLPEKPTPETAAALVGPLLEAGADRQAVGVAAASRHVTRTRVWTDALGLALAEAGRRVVIADLTSRSEPGEPGVLDVVEDGRRLADVVEIHPELSLARVGAGADHGAALQALAGIFPRLPRDIEVLLVALPPLASPAVLGAAASLDQVVVLAQTDITSRVDLIASLDAVDAIGAGSEVLLLDSRMRRNGNGAGQAPPPAAPPDPDVSSPPADVPGADGSTDAAVTDQDAGEPPAAPGAHGTHAFAPPGRADERPPTGDALPPVEAPAAPDDALPPGEARPAPEGEIPAPGDESEVSAPVNEGEISASGDEGEVSARGDESEVPAPEGEVPGDEGGAPTSVDDGAFTSLDEDDDWAVRVISHEPLMAAEPDAATSGPGSPEPDVAGEAGAADDVRDTDEIPRVRPTPPPAPDAAAGTSPSNGASPPIAPQAVDTDAPDAVDSEAPLAVDPDAPQALDTDTPDAADSDTPQAVDADAPDPPDTDATEVVDAGGLDDRDDVDEEEDGGEIRSLAAIDALTRQMDDRELGR